MNIQRRAECVRELVRVQLHFGLQNIGWVGRERRRYAGDDAAAEVDEAGSCWCLQPFWGREKHWYK